jgi:hypothetical protein
VATVFEKSVETLDVQQFTSLIGQASRPSHSGAVSASLTLAWRAVLKIKHVPWQLLDVTMYPILITLMFAYIFGGALAGSTSEYVQFLIPGTLVQTVAMISMYTAPAFVFYVQYQSSPILTKPAPFCTTDPKSMLHLTLRADKTAQIVLSSMIIDQNGQITRVEWLPPFTNINEPCGNANFE